MVDILGAVLEVMHGGEADGEPESIEMAMLMPPAISVGG
jgi:hypothetical protein